jgi:N-acetylglucosamine-6-sulfatase
MRYPHGDGSPDRHKAELYDVQGDSEERHNLIEEPALARKVRELQGELARLMEASGLTPEKDKMPLDEGVKKELPDAKIR